MSFSTDTKDELIQMPLENLCCMMQELGAITQTSASLSLQGKGRFQLTYQVESTPLARRIFLLLRQGFSITPALHFVQHPRFKTKRSTVLTIEYRDATKLLTAFEMLEENGDGQFSLSRMTPRQNPTKRCCRNAFLRGAFLGAGTITNPDKSYHLEVRTPKDSFYKNLVDVMHKSGFSPKTTLRQGQNVVYLKQGDQIVSFLAATGAHKALMRMEDTRIQKELLNQINRSMNCDHYNMDKQLNAAQKQMEAIAVIDKHLGLNSLEKSLKETAHIRLQNPDASIASLGAMMTPPLGKSGMNHRLSKLMAIANHCYQQKEDLL